ncbi:MAG: helix-turn-helix domain-containing protein [Lachnospiraceae bacterium]
MKIHGDENNNFILKEIGNRIKELRLKSNTTQRELSAEAGVSYSTILRIESGEGTTLENLIRVLRVFNLLQNFDLLVPEQELTPSEIFYNKPKRKRATGQRNVSDSDWKWGDEK